MANSMPRRSALALLGAGVVSSAAHAAPSLAATVDAAFSPLIARYDVPGIAVGVTISGVRSFFAFGTASRATGAAITDDTLFELGSISKLFAATLAAQAEAIGAVKLDAKVETLVPELRGAPIGRTTLLDLATYTAGGLPLQFPDDVEDERSALAWFRRWKPDAPSGRLRRYSNPSIVLLGLAVSRTLELSPAEAIEGLLPQLGLRRSVVRVPEAAMERYAQGTDTNGHSIRLRPNPFPAAAYGVKATTIDMLAFLEPSLSPDRLDPPLRRAVEATQRPRYRVGPMAQGLGWEIYDRPMALDRLLAGNSTDMATKPHRAEPLGAPAARDRTLLSKTGSTNGFGAYVALVPAKATGLVMLANRNLPIPARVTAAHAVLAAVGG